MDVYKTCEGIGNGGGFEIKMTDEEINLCKKMYRRNDTSWGLI